MVDHHRLKLKQGVASTVISDIVIWRLTDGRQGHERQTEGLTGALAALGPTQVHSLAVSASAPQRFKDFCVGRFPGGFELPSPSLIIGAGSACQWPLLAARRARGGRSIYLMRPSLPCSWFDLCIIPGHDRPNAAPRVIVSEGPLNPMQAGDQERAEGGLIVLGGPSVHHAWNTPDILQQVSRITARRPEIAWQITDSRRSPGDLREALASFAKPNTTFHPHESTANDWLPETMARSRYIWVSADSVAMMFEALTAGACVGIIDVPANRRDRITELSTDLKARYRVATVDAWLEDGTIDTVSEPLDEARRCARLITERWAELYDEQRVP